MAINVQNDATFILEDGQAINGNVFSNDVTSPNQTSELVVKPGSLISAVPGEAENNGVIQGKYGQLTLHSDGTYTYKLNKDMDYLGAGVDLHDEVFTYTAEWHDPANVDHSEAHTIKIDIHGTNDASVIKDVSVTVYEGNDRTPWPNNNTVLKSVNPYETFTGELKLEDVNPTLAGVQTDLDTDDTHTFKIDGGTITLTSSNLTAEQIAAIKPTIKVELVDPNASEGDANFGKYTVKGDFDALSEGDQAKVTFQYQSVDHSAAGSISEGDPKTVTVTVMGQNDRVHIVGDYITRYDDLIDGDIYKSILANDGHYGWKETTPGNWSWGLQNDIDVNDKLSIVSTGYRDLDFYKGGGQISVDNAAKTLQYTPGGGGAIAKDHFEFYYEATDGHTDPIQRATATFAMRNKDNQEIDFYQFGDNGTNTINGIKGKTNVLSGMGGDDYLEGKEKGDILYGGAGDDDLHGGWGNDIYKAGKGTDGMVDTRGNDLYVFSKGDGRNTIDDTNLEIYKDAMNHEVINWQYWDNEDIVKFDKSVNYKEIALFQEDGQYGSLLIKYSKNADDKVSVGWQKEAHYGVEKIEAEVEGVTKSITLGGGALQFDKDGDGTKDLTYDQLISYIATYDLDGDISNGVQAAQNVQDVQNNTHLMSVIASGWA